MPRLFVYFYLMKHEPESRVIDDHIGYWKGLALEHHKGGPFNDRSGGLITFETQSIEEATRLAENNPFILNKLIDQHWVKEWIPG